MQSNIDIDLCRKCYLLCEMNYWNSEKIKSKMNLSPQEIKQYAKEYLINYVDGGEKKYKTLFLFFLEPKDKKLFYDYNSIILQMIQLKYIDETQRYNVEWVTKNLYEYICKFCYDICVKLKWNKSEIIYYCEINLINNENFQNLSRKYIDISFSKKQKEEYEFEFNFKPKHKEIIDDMLRLNYISELQINNNKWGMIYLENYVCKYSYDIYEKFKWDAAKIEEYCNNLLISFNDLDSYARKHIDNMEHLSEKQKQRYNLLFLTMNKKYPRIYTVLLNLEKKDEIIKFIDESAINFNSLKHGLHDYISVYHSGNKEKYINLFNKLQIYNEYIQNIKDVEKDKKHKEYIEKNIKISKKIITDYINSNSKSIDEFCCENNIIIDYFYELLEIVKQNEEELYEKYSEHQQKIKKTRFAVLLQKNLNVIKLIKTGIFENGEFRKFDLLDYYENTNQNFQDFLTIVKGNLNKDDYKIIKVFIKRYKNDKKLTPLDIKNIYNTKTIIGVEFDANGKIIEGSGIELTKVQKQSVLNYLESKNIPITNITYNLALKRRIISVLNPDNSPKIKQKNLK